MDRAPIKLGTPASLAPDEKSHNVAGTDLTISALYYSGNNGEGFTEFKLEGPMTNSVKNEENMGDDVMDPSSGIISDLVVIAPQVDNYHNYGVSMNGKLNAPDLEKEIKQDISAVKREIMGVVIKKEKNDIVKEEIDNNQIIKEEVHDCKEYIKLEDDMNCSNVHNLIQTVKPEEQSVVINNEFDREGIQKDLVEFERIDENVDNQMSKIVIKSRISPRTARMPCYDLKRHQRTHTEEKPYECTTCDQSFRNQSNLKVHQRIHTGEKPYACTMCDRSFRDLGSLKRHLRTHTGEKPYACTLCDKCFSDLGNLQRHQRTHTGEKPYGCTICGKCFIDRSALKVHQRTHTAEKPFGCTMCDQGFRSQQALRYHQRRHRGEKPHECTKCDQSFILQQGLQYHRRTHTGEKPYV